MQQIILDTSKKRKNYYKTNAGLPGCRVGFFSAHQVDFQFFLKWFSVGISVIFKGISFQVFKAKYENPFWRTLHYT